MRKMPTVTEAEIQALVPSCSNVVKVGQGGQKVVFKAEIAGTVYAIKVALIEDQSAEVAHFNSVDETYDSRPTPEARRAEREIETMRRCDCDYVVKLGPIALEFGQIRDERILFFSEEYIEGSDLQTVVSNRQTMPPDEIRTLGIHITTAIKALWAIRRVHRDIKPANIIHRKSNGAFVLLDAGLAFDRDDVSISVGIVGTPLYFSPEQLDFANRRTVMDFRSDIFSLGVTLYVMASNRHPFMEPGDMSDELYSKIKNHVPARLSEVVQGFPEELSDTIHQMMGKSPHLRFRRCDDLIAAFGTGD